MKIKKAISFLAIFVFSVSMIKAQDAQISLFTASPLYMNPAAAGVVPDKTQWRAQVNYRGQWGSFLDKAIRTNSFSFDLPIPKKKISVGVLIMNNTATKGSVSDLCFMPTFAWATPISDGSKNYISFGAQAGFRQISFDQDELKWGDEYVAGEGFTNETKESFANTSVGFADFNFGIMYYVKDNWKVFKPFLGITALHLSEPKEVFDISENVLSRKYITSGGADFAINSSFAFTPKFMYAMQKNHSQFSIGSIFYLSTKKDKQKTTVGLGAYYRSDDAISTMISFNWENYTMMIDYEINTSELKAVSNSIGGMEVALRYHFKTKRRSNVKLM